MKKSVSDVASFNEVKMHCRKMIQDRFEQKVVWEALLEEYQRLENQHFEK